MVFHNVEAERARLGLTQTRLAEMLGITLTTYTSYRTGKTSPDVSLILDLCNIFHCSADYIIGRTNVREVS